MSSRYNCPICHLRPLACVHTWQEQADKHADDRKKRREEEERKFLKQNNHPR